MHRAPAMKRLCFLLTLGAGAWPGPRPGGGGGAGGGSGPGSGCNGSCQTTSPQRLEVADVQQVIAQAVAEAQAQKAGATIAVVDRAGNVLGVFRMSTAGSSVTVNSERNTGTGLDGLGVVPSPLAAISKAITGAYLSSEGNAFSTRTASQIVQEHFNPGDLGQPGGPLFGVQFSSLPCSDFNTRYIAGAGADIGPKRSPLGLSADSGGFPLYKNGTVVGGVGVMADGVYSLDLDITVPEHGVDELIAIAATSGFDAPTDRRADEITVGGFTLRYTDVEVERHPHRRPQHAELQRRQRQRALEGGARATPPLGSVILPGTYFGKAAARAMPPKAPKWPCTDSDAFRTTVRRRTAPAPIRRRPLDDGLAQRRLQPKSLRS